MEPDIATDTYQSAFSRAASQLLEAVDVRAVGGIVVDTVLRTGAVAAAFALYDKSESALRLVYQYGFAATLAERFIHYQPGSDTPIGRILESGETMSWSIDEFAEVFPALTWPVTHETFGRLIAIPLRTHGHPIGGMTAAYPDRVALPGQAASFLNVLGTAAAAAIERVRAVESERRRSEEAEALARVSRALMDARTLEQVGELAWREAARLLNASRGAFYLVDRQPGQLLLVGRSGMSEVLEARTHRIALSFPTPETECVNMGQPVVVESEADYQTRYPEARTTIFGADGRETPPAATLAVPVRSNTDVIGTLSFGFRAARRFSERDRWLAMSFADAAASAVERLRLFHSEREARKHATALARASAALFEAQDPYGVGRIVMEETRVVTGACAGTIMLFDPNDDTFYSIATFGSAAARPPTSVRRPVAERSIVGDVIREGRAIVVESVEEYARRYPAYAEMVREGNSKVTVGVPLIVRGRTIGAFSSSYDDRDHLSAQEIALLQSIGNTAAEAIDRLRSVRLLEAVVAQMPLGVLVVDPQGRVIALNEQVTQLWHGSAPLTRLEDWVGWRAFHPDGRPFATTDWPIWRSLQAGDLVIGQSIEIERFDGTRATLDYSSAPMRDEHGSVIGGVVVMADASGRVEAERAREAFLAVLSHELRTPITAILLASRRLHTRVETLDSATRRDLLFDMEAEAERLNRVVGNLLVVSRVERGADLRSTEPVLLQHLLPGLVQSEANLWPDVAFELSAAPRLPMIQGEQGYLEQVLRNLMGNAAKYGGKRVRVSVSAGSADLEIRVRDWGPGISPEDRPRVFDLFYRSPQMTQSAVGAGIGLFVVRNLVEAMGGRVWMEEPADGPGACFVVSLPLMRVDP